ncbi:MAG: cobalt-precorrin 5A hydrolase / precorrin-3B C17-methyltransferase [Nitrospirae bacterium]|nr:MAG: cobalt-precorrin 5A hydrolase / precorrin-3B C17-methyltransferase [Nitrospirota bacterium]
MKSKTIIFYITNNGLNIANKLKTPYPDAQVLKFGQKAIPGLWKKSASLIFIMATGIVVRTIAPLIKNKKTDPAVVVLDEKGRFAVSLLSGHIGGANNIAKQIADFLGGEAVITTASDVNNMPSIDLWAMENNLVIENWEAVPEISARFLNKGELKVYSEVEVKMPEGFLREDKLNSVDVLITNKQFQISNLPPRAGRRGDKSQIFLRPQNLMVGIGCNSGTAADEIEDAVKGALSKNRLSFLSVQSVATIDKKGAEPGLLSFAGKYNLKINTFTPDELNSVSDVEKSEAAFKATGANAVAEPAAMLASGAGKLLVRKQKIGNVTVSVAEQRAKSKEQRQGKLYIVGTGPGTIKHITPYAQNVIKESDIIVGYGTYLDLIKELTRGKEVISTGMTKEIDRCQKAVGLAMSGRTVSVISGGDPGIYAMAGLVFEILRAAEQQLHGESVNRLIGKSQKQSSCSPIHPFTHSPIHVEVIPGISALNACAARLGAPLMHDFAAISLSDRLTPWKLIEERLESAAKTDFVIVLYNPKSMGRPEHINKAREIILKHRAPETPVGIVRAAMRENESIVVTNLRDMLNYDIDMQTTVIIGNSRTFVWDNRMITPRGYEKKFKI